MARAVFARATVEDDDDIRRLLRENPLGGRYSLSLEREPDAFAAPHDPEFVLARDGLGGEAIGLYERCVWPAYVNGMAVRLPYLGALRVAASHRHRIAILRDGYASLRGEFADRDDFPVALTSITSDNMAAIRVLTAGLRGLPVYRRFADFTTLVLRPQKTSFPPEVARASAADLPELVDFLSRHNAQFQFAPVVTGETLAALAPFGLTADRFLLFRSGGVLRGCVALWNTQGFRQAVVRRYPPLLGKLRAPANLVASLTGRPALPREGMPVSQVMFSHLAVADDAPDVFVALIDAARTRAAEEGFGAAVLGLATDRRLAALARRRFRGIAYATTLFLVHWPDQAEAAEKVMPLLPHPDIALL